MERFLIWTRQNNVQIKAALQSPGWGCVSSWVLQTDRERHTDRHTDGDRDWHADRQRLTGRQAGRQAGRQIETETDR